VDLFILVVIVIGALITALAPILPCCGRPQDALPDPVSRKRWHCFSFLRARSRAGKNCWGWIRSPNVHPSPAIGPSRTLSEWLHALGRESWVPLRIGLRHRRLLVAEVYREFVLDGRVSPGTERESLADASGAVRRARRRGLIFVKRLSRVRLS